MKKFTVVALMVSALTFGSQAAFANETQGEGFDTLKDLVTKTSQTMQQQAPDTTFAKTMIAHYESSIEIAKLELQHGKDADARKFAESVITNQTKDIATLKAWLEKNPAAK
ncbi:DUF305 domain-containing protein [Zophobihabitans entericus]|uniref:DUF305 domain-containing protein n=1 Tax=Zophobihabitans entericus TaxID=1635327 RepID=A0A6G9IBE2_9GAMM|nr:DUF305 domain-containing protein [Zophobihabitans entericus]QIQ21543.1 DUF305 domain-containing protein [Zophobihabitans entericus]